MLIITEFYSNYEMINKIYILILLLKIFHGITKETSNKMYTYYTYICRLHSVWILFESSTL